MNIFECQSVCYAYHPQEDGHGGLFAPRSSYALDLVNLEIPKGSRLALIGANGAGKSTLMKHLNGLLKPTKGQVRFQGNPIDYSRKSLIDLRSRVGYVFQNPDHHVVAPTVYQDLVFGPTNMGMSLDKIHEKMRKICEAFSLLGLLEKSVFQLSFGQKKLVSLAGVWLMEPSVLLLDEPTLGLDLCFQDLLDDFLRKFHRDGGTLIMVSHDWDFLARHADRAVLMDQGKIARHDDLWNLLSDEEVMRKHGLRPHKLALLARKLDFRTFEVSELLGRILDHPTARI